MNDVAVVTNKGTPLMPTTRARARVLLKKGRAKIYKYRPVFTIMILDREDGEVQDVELKIDTGDHHIGISVCSEKHEYLHRQYDLLTDEPERHKNQKMYRNGRRNRKWHRKPKPDKNRGSEGWIAPTIEHKIDQHVMLVKEICEVMPVKEGYAEMGTFDTQMLQAMEKGEPLPQGEDYQHGPKYQTETLRQAVFQRDGYQCIVCKRSGVSKENRAILHVHHIGFWKHDRTNRLDNLATVCEKCHTSKNHQPGGKLYGLEPELKTLKSAAFMNIARFRILKELKKACPDVIFHMTYGAQTKIQRTELNIPKSHANDAYAMGKLHPKHRARLEHFQKRRRNNRILEKFYDATYIDTRDGEKKKAAELGCNRTKRNIPRNNPENLRCFRGKKLTKGHRSIRRNRYPLQPGDIVEYKGRRYIVKGMKNNGNAVALAEGPNPSIRNVRFVKRLSGGWIRVPV